MFRFQVFFYPNNVTKDIADWFDMPFYFIQYVGHNKAIRVIPILCNVSNLHI